MSARGQHRRRTACAVAVNAVEIAINGSRRLPAEDVLGQRLLLARARDEFARGVDCERHWATLADTANLSESLSAMGLGRGQDADEVHERAQRALADVHGRHQQRGTWTLYADEIEALYWLGRLYLTQIAACSQREFAGAYRRTRDRMAGALAGNVAAGVTVVVVDAQTNDVGAC